MNRRSLQQYGLLLLLAVLGGVWIVLSREPVEESQNFLTEAPMVGHLAPDFTLPTPAGETIALGDYVSREGEEGRPVVLNFWASWCGPCRIETPYFQTLSRRYQGQVAFLGVNQGESLDTITDFAASYGLSYPLLYDPDNAVNDAYQVFNLPTTIFIDARGVIREVYVGAISEAVLQDRVNQLLREGT